jgi:hypothetical protein
MSRPAPASRREQQPAVKVVSGGETAALHGLSLERQELLCSLIALAVKLGLARLTSAYQERMERQGELAAVLELEQTKLLKARERFDQLFMLEGEQRLIREQSQWIAPNRLRVVWSNPEQARPSP